jgi:hypothetical protein
MPSIILCFVRKDHCLPIKFEGTGKLVLPSFFQPVSFFSWKKNEIMLPSGIRAKTSEPLGVGEVKDWHKIPRKMIISLMK